MQLYEPAAAENAVRTLLSLPEPKQVYLASTGAGAGATQLLWQIPGASSTLVGSAFPYKQNDFDLFVGRKWSKTGFSYCSAEAAIALAQAAYFRCQEVCEAKGDIIGVGLSAAVATTRILRGGTRFHLATRTNRGIACASFTIDQGRLGRSGDGDLCDIMMLNAIMVTAGLPQTPITFPDGVITCDEMQRGHLGWFLELRPPALHIRVKDLESPTLINLDGNPQPLVRRDYGDVVIYPASANPLHFGHDQIARSIQALTGKQVIFEITGKNADKDDCSDDVLIRRAQQFLARWPVILTRGDGLFRDKAIAYPEADFAVGVDTVERILDPRFYGNEKRRDRCLRDFAEQGIVFHVNDRINKDGKVVRVSDLPIPYAFRDVFQRNPAGVWDISSTQLRNARAAHETKEPHADLR